MLHLLLCDPWEWHLQRRWQCLRQLKRKESEGKFVMTDSTRTYFPKELAASGEGNECKRRQTRTTRLFRSSDELFSSRWRLSLTLEWKIKPRRVVRTLFIPCKLKTERPEKRAKFRADEKVRTRESTFQGMTAKPSNYSMTEDRKVIKLQYENWPQSRWTTIWGYQAQCCKSNWENSRTWCVLMCLRRVAQHRVFRGQYCQCAVRLFKMMWLAKV